MQRIGNYIYSNGRAKLRIKKNYELKKINACKKMKENIDESSMSDIAKDCNKGLINLEQESAESRLKHFKPKETLRSYKKIKYYELRNIIIAYINNTDKSYITKEEISHKYNVKQHFVENIFRELNREGILSQRKSNYAHDTNRNPMFDGVDSGWACDLFYIRKRPNEL